MPMLSLKCTKDIPQELLAELSAAVADAIGKPEQYVMVLAEQANLMMSGIAGDAAYGEVKSIGGLDSFVNGELTSKLCELLSSRLGIPTNRVYVTFNSVTADHWGFDGSTFG